MAHVNRRIGKSSETAITTTDGTGGGVLDSFMHDYFQRSGNVYNAPGALVIEGIQATGGVINDYTEGTDVYRSHIFTSSGTFTVNSFGTGSSMTNNVHYVVIGGGGGGAYSHGGAAGGGGGAGGVAGNDPYIPSTYRKGALTISAGPTAYTVTVGGGGLGGYYQGDTPSNPDVPGTNGSNSS